MENSYYKLDIRYKLLIISFIVLFATIFLVEKHHSYVKTLVRQQMKLARNPLICENYASGFPKQRCSINLSLPFNQNQYTLMTQMLELNTTLAFIKDRINYHMENMSVNPIMYKTIVKSLNATATILQTALDRFEEWDSFLTFATLHTMQTLQRKTTSA